MGFDFVREYVNAPTFRGFRRVYVTAFGDLYGAFETAMAFLGDRDVIDFKGATVTLSGFTYDGGQGIHVGVNGYHVGTIWPQNSKNKEYFGDVFNGTITGVFLRIERDKWDPTRPVVNLFVGLPST